MNTEKFQAVLNYYKENNIQLPTAVQNAIEDVFMENDNIESVDCYHPDELDQLQDDLTVNNHLKMILSNTDSVESSFEGFNTDVFTYYGNISYSYSEKTEIYDETGELIQSLSDNENDEKTIIDTPNDYCVVVRETFEYDSTLKKKERITKLIIYCPESVEDDLPEEDEELQSIYSKLRSDL